VRARALEVLSVTALLALALAFRLHLDDSGDSPWTFLRNDEVHYLTLATDFLNGRWSVDYFINPTLHAYLVWAASAAFGALAVLAGRFESFAAFRLEATLDPWWVLMPARVIAVASGVLAVGVLYAIGRRLSEPRTGFAAALALAVDATHVERSLIGVNEAPMVLLVLAFYLALQRHIARPSVGRHVLAGTLLGLACSTKYNAGVHLVTFAAGTLLAARGDAGSPYWRRIFASRHLTGFLATPVAFVAGSPWTVLNPAGFLRDFRAQSSYLTEGFVQKEKIWEVNGWLRYLESFPAENVGLAFSIACALGLLLAAWRGLRRRESGALLLLSATLPAYLFLGAGTFLLMRFLLPAIPFVLLAGAWAVCLTVDRALPAALPARAWVARGALSLALAALLAPHALATWESMETKYGRTDRCAQAAHIVREVVEPGVSYLDLVYPPVFRFFDDFTRVRRYRIRESELASAPERERWQRFQSDLVRSSELTGAVNRSPDMAAFRKLLDEEGWKRLILMLPLDKSLHVDRPDDPSEVFAQRRALIKQIRPHEPALARCPYWDELLDFLVSLEPVELRLTPNRQIFLAVLAFPEDR
jgi:hypothetical protein